MPSDYHRSHEGLVDCDGQLVSGNVGNLHDRSSAAKSRNAQGAASLVILCIEEASADQWMNRVALRARYLSAEAQGSPLRTGAG
jgi:hypothetical protein